MTRGRIHRVFGTRNKMDMQVNVKVHGGFKQTLKSIYQRVGTGTTPFPRVKQNLTVNKCIDPGVSYSIPKGL